MWSFDGGMQDNADAFGYRVARESTFEDAVEPPDYRVGRVLLGLEDVTIGLNGEVAPQPLKNTTIEGPGMTGTPGHGGDDGVYIDIGPELNEAVGLDPRRPEGPGGGDGNGGGGGGGGGGPEPAGRPAGWPSWNSVAGRLHELLPVPEGKEATAAGIVLLETKEGTAPSEHVYTGRSGEEEGIPRSDLTQPARRVYKPGVEYGPDETGALTRPVSGRRGRHHDTGLVTTKDAGIGRRVEENMEWLARRDETVAGNNPQKLRRLEKSRRSRAEAMVGEEEKAQGHGHSGSREHDAEAKMLEQVSAALHVEENMEWLARRDETVAGNNPQKLRRLEKSRRSRAEAMVGEEEKAQGHHSGSSRRGEVHLETNFATCPSCIEMIYRFRSKHPNVQIVVHVKAGKTGAH